MNEHKHEVFSVKKAKYLTRWVRNVLQNPHRILKPYIKDGMTVLDFGCGPGFFTIAAAKLVGKEGRVIAVDLQQEMLDMLKKRINGNPIGKNIALHKCIENSLGVKENVDFVIAFHVVHEVPSKDGFFDELKVIVKSGGMVLLSEPKHRVNAAEFDETLRIAEKHGFKAADKPKICMDRTVVLRLQNRSSI